MRALKMTIPVGLLIGMLVVLVGKIHSQPPVRDKVLDEVEIVESEGNVFVEVLFSFPLRYRSHFPQENGDELRIQLQPVRVPVSDVNAVPRREAVVPRYADVASVDEVIYEGDITGGPYLTVRFTRPVSYQVVPGSDYRSVRVIIRSFE
jgi:hypothetical protein